MPLIPTVRPSIRLLENDRFHADDVVAAACYAGCGGQAGGSLALPFITVAGSGRLPGCFFPRFLFPSLIDVFWRCVEILVTGSMLSDVIATVLRILGGLVGAFVCGSLVALVMARSAAADRFLAPILSLLQGIPALSWVVFAIIWFHGIEFRIFFIMVVTTLPASRSRCSGVAGDVQGPDRDGAQLRPTRVKLFRAMILPAVLPDILTAWRSTS